MNELPPRLPLTRRQALIGAGAALATVAVAACSRDSDTNSAGSTTQQQNDPSTSSSSSSSGTTDVAALSSGTPSSTVFTAADFAGLGACLVLPELTEGPFPTVNQIERRDITEGLAGLPLRVGVQVVDEACTPIPNATVEIWHCDIDGDYSAYADGYTDDDAGEGTTFFRGSQVTNDEGIVEFHTVWPGWYSGRAVHIHSKVHIDDTTVLTTQFLFDDSLNDEVLTQGVYAPFGEPDTTNETDGVTSGNGVEDGLLFTVSDDSGISGKRALIVVGLDPDAESSAGGGQSGAPGGRPGGGPNGR